MNEKGIERRWTIWVWPDGSISNSGWANTTRAEKFEVCPVTERDRLEKRVVEVEDSRDFWEREWKALRKRLAEVEGERDKYLGFYEVTDDHRDKWQARAESAEQQLERAKDALIGAKGALEWLLEAVDPDEAKTIEYHISQCEDAL